MNEAAAIATAWQAVARGGEVAAGSETGPVRGDVEWIRAKFGVEQHAVLWLKPIKNFKADGAPKVPIPIAKGNKDGSDAYYLLRRLEKYDPVAKDKRNSTPLFRDGKGKGMLLAKFTKICKRVATLAGIPDKWVGAHSPRIGAATDLIATSKGDSRHVLKAKGRWASDMGYTYARMTQSAQLDASRSMQEDKGQDYESIYPTFVQN